MFTSGVAYVITPATTVVTPDNGQNKIYGIIKYL